MGDSVGSDSSVSLAQRTQGRWGRAVRAQHSSLEPHSSFTCGLAGCTPIVNFGVVRAVQVLY